MRTRVRTIKTFMALQKAHKLTPEITEQLLLQSDDSQEMSQLFIYLSHGGELPKDWEKKVSEDDPALMSKALPKKDRTGDDKDAKKTKSKKASSKKAGKTGKTRYNYPQDKQQPKKSGGQKNAPKQDGPQRASEKHRKEEEAGADPIAVPHEPVPKNVDPQQIANQLQIPLHTLQHIAQRFVKNPKLEGRAGFVSFMQTKMKAFAEKYKLDGDYWGLLYDALVGTEPTVATKI